MMTIWRFNMVKIVIDTREQDPLPVRNAEKGTCFTGDYSVKGLEDYIAIERKSIPDLVSSVTHGRKRFENECRRMKGLLFRRLVIIGTEQDIWKHNYRSKTNPKSVIHTLEAWEVRFDLPYVFIPTVEEAARYVERKLHNCCYEFAVRGKKALKAKVDDENG